MAGLAIVPSAPSAQSAPAITLPDGSTTMAQGSRPPVSDHLSQRCAMVEILLFGIAKPKREAHFRPRHFESHLRHVD